VYTGENDQIILESFRENFTLQEIQSFQIPDFAQGLTPSIKQMCNLNHNEHNGSCCDFPPVDHIDKWYLDQNGNIQIDNSWDLKLMPVSVIYEKNNKIKNDIIDNELNQENPDVISLIRSMRSKEKTKLGASLNADQSDIKKLYEEALSNLDYRVSNGEPDKPVIRQKLEAKIASFE